MRLKSFIAIYLLILTILFSSVNLVSFYLNNSQIDMLKDKSAGQFQTIVSSLDRDIAAIWGRDGIDNASFPEAVDTLVRGYARYYSRHNVSISVNDLRLSEQNNDQHISEIFFATYEDESFIVITGLLTEPFEYFLLDYSLNITENITGMRNIQNTLLFSAIVFAIIAAFSLYLILSSIFKPLTTVANASRKIANGNFDERITVKAKNELAQVAIDFNKMAERIERHIILLEEEAVSKQQFVDNFAHEMRTPLTSIYGYAEYMQKAVLEDGEIVELSERIMNRTSYLKEIANSLLQLAMLRDYIPDKCEIDIQSLFDNISQTVKAQMNEAGVNFICKNDATTLHGQEDLIKSLLLNLCLNAIKACSPNESIIFMEAKNENENITLSVRDNGCGIPTDSLSKVTEPFYRVDKARSKKQGGAGLGLALCQKIAEAHGAKMVIESTVGVGTAVKITFTSS